MSADLPFTFGIITDASKGVNEHLPQVVQSIRELHLPQYEIIIVGDKKNIEKHEILVPHPLLTVIDFDETIKPKWITKKKNLITQHAKYENVVYQHDYIVYNKDWYEGFKKLGNDWVVCVPKIQNLDGTRFRGANTLFPDVYSEKMWKYTGIKNNESMLPYEETRFSKWQYVSGSYWVAKKRLMEEIPLREDLVWSQGEDCEFSYAVRAKYNFTTNPYSTVHLLKYKDPAFGPIRPECYAKLVEYWEKIQKGEIKDWW